LLSKLYEGLGIKPKAPEPEKPAASAAVGHRKVEDEKESDRISDNYEDDWDASDDGLDWDADKKKIEPVKISTGSKPPSSTANEDARANDARSNMYFGMNQEDGKAGQDSTDLLDEIPTINETKVESNAGNAMQNNFKIDQEDQFNKVVGGTEKGGLLASAGISKEETRKAAEKGVEDEDDNEYEYGT
jgi:hypothetical protein